jgi:hypothetical protein
MIRESPRLKQSRLRREAFEKQQQAMKINIEEMYEAQISDEKI